MGGDLVANSATTNGATILTIPANKTWYGSVMLGATLAVLVGGSAATSYPAVTLHGTGGTWTDGDLVASLALFVPAVGLTALTGSTATAAVSTGPISITARANPITLTLDFTTAGTSAVATAAGEIL